MNSSIKFLIFAVFIILSISFSASQQNPKSLIFPITKDESTLQYTTHLGIGTPNVQKKLVVDLGGRYLWIDCETGYNSTTHKPGKCGSSTCSITKPFGFGCTDCKQTPHKDCTCSLIPVNTVTGLARFEAVGVDTVSAHILNGPKSKPTVSIPNFIFSCAQHSLLKGLAKGAKGMASLGRNTISLPNQFSSALGGSMRKKFAICLPTNSTSDGVLLFGDAKYVFHQSSNTSERRDVSARSTTIPMYINPISTSKIYIDGEKSTDYFVGLTSIFVMGGAIPINAQLLKFDKYGFGGTRISTVEPYTILESSIFAPFVAEVDKYYTYWNMSRVAPVAPFSACYDSNSPNHGYYPWLGMYAPYVELKFENMSSGWGMYGANNMIEVSKDVICLAFVDQGVPMHIQPSVVIGAYQLQDHLVQFDLASSRFSFSPTLHLEEAECGNYVPAL